MTDQERFIQLMQDFGIDVTATDVDRGAATGYSLKANKTNNVEGYYGFFADFAFDAQGKFLRAGVWG